MYSLCLIKNNYKIFTSSPPEMNEPRSHDSDVLHSPVFDIYGAHLKEQHSFVQIRKASDPTTHISMIKEKCTTKANLVDRIVKEYKTSQDCFNDTLNDKKKALEMLVQEEFTAIRRRLEEMENDFLSTINKSVTIDQEGLQELNKKIAVLEEDSKRRRLNIENMDKNEDFIVDLKEDPSFQGIMHPQKIFSDHSATISIQQSLADLVIKLENSFVKLKTETDEGLQHIEGLQKVFKEDQEKSEKENEINASRLKKAKFFEEKIELLGMKDYITVKEDQGVFVIRFEDRTQLNRNIITDRLLIDSGTLRLYFNEYHELKNKFQLDRPDFLSGVDYLIQGLDEIKEIEYDTNLQSVLEQTDDLSVILEYQIGSALEVKKILYVNIESSHFEGHADPTAHFNSFLRLRKNTNEVFLRIKTQELSDKTLESLIKGVLPLSERFGLFGLMLLYSGEKQDTLAIILMIVAEMMKSQVFISNIRKSSKAIYFYFTMKSSSQSGTRKFLISLVLEEKSEYTKADLIQIIAEAIAPKHYRKIEKEYLETKDWNSALLFLKDNNIFKAAQ